MFLAAVFLLSFSAGVARLIIGPYTPRYEAAATSITPITSYSDGASGLTFSGDAYDVTCTVSTDTVTLYAAMHDGTSWRVYDATACTLAVGSGRTCRFPAEKQTGQTWNAYKTGSGSVASCTAKQAFGPLAKRQPSGGSTPTPDPWADIPLILHLAADQEDVADGYALATLADRSSVAQDLTTTGSVTYDADGGPGGTPCYVFPADAYATRLDPTLPQGTTSPGFAVLAVVNLSDLSGYPEVLEMGLADRTADGAHHNYQNAVASTGALYSANTGGDSERFSTAGVVSVDTWTIVGWRWTKGAAMSSTNPRYLVNGATVSAASGTGTATANLTREAVRVGASLLATPAQFLRGSLAELVVLPTDDESTFTAASAILEAKYSL